MDSILFLEGGEMDQNDWRILRLLVKLLEAPHNLTLKMSSDASSISTVIPDIRVLQVY